MISLNLNPFSLNILVNDGTPWATIIAVLFVVALLFYRAIPNEKPKSISITKKKKK